MKELKTYRKMRDVFVTWHCTGCDNTVAWTYYDLATRGDPVCPNCDSDMVLEE